MSLSAILWSPMSVTQKLPIALLCGPPPILRRRRKCPRTPSCSDALKLGRTRANVVQSRPKITRNRAGTAHNHHNRPRPPKSCTRNNGPCTKVGTLSSNVPATLVFSLQTSPHSPKTAPLYAFSEAGSTDCVIACVTSLRRSRSYHVRQEKHLHCNRHPVRSLQTRHVRGGDGIVLAKGIESAVRARQ